MEMVQEYFHEILVIIILKTHNVQISEMIKTMLSPLS
jgi:hypothetical protein